MEETGQEIIDSASKDSHKSRSFKRICVYCGSRSGYKPAFSDATLVLAKLLVERKIDLVYGGGSLGLMGLISKTVFNGGCHVLGVIPEAVFPREISGETFGEEKIVADMHERKSEMSKLADAFIALPGGYGTMEELLEVIAWSELGIHNKPVGLLNVEGYFNCLLQFFDKGVDEGFIDSTARNLMVVAETPAELIHKMELITIRLVEADKIKVEEEKVAEQLLEAEDTKQEKEKVGSHSAMFKSSILILLTTLCHPLF